MIQRSLKAPLLKDLNEKIILLSGPRQCGKTTLSKNLFKNFDYLNYDSAADREILKSQTWNRKTNLIVFDEIHKMKNWKSWIKGVYDKEGLNPRLLVTGSARMSRLKKTGDSLAGRHFNYHLHPFDLKELNLKTLKEKESALETLLNVGGFPEPFLKGSRRAYNRWSASHLDVILRQDLIDLEVIRDIKSIEVLISLLAQKTGSKISYAALASDLNKDPKTIARWLDLLETLYVIFRVTPYHKNLSQALLKESKYYFYDTGRVQGDESARFENLVACSLLKELHRVFDTQGIRGRLHFIRTKTGKEIDFLVFIEKKTFLIEVKWQDSSFSPNFKYFFPHFKKAKCVQLVKVFHRAKTTPEGWSLERAESWLSQIDFSKP